MRTEGGGGSQLLKAPYSSQIAKNFFMMIATCPKPTPPVEQEGRPLRALQYPI